MFGFLFKRGKRAAVASTPVEVAINTATREVDRQNRAVAARKEALDAAGALPDEAATIAFIATCTVPEARLLAAQGVHTRAGLEQVRRQCRDTDRRVVRLVQQRLDQHDKESAARQHAEAVLDDARRLAGESALRANQVVALEQRWQAIALPPAAVQAEYAAVHAALEQRLQKQAALQRRMLDAIAQARAALTAPADPDSDRTPMSTSPSTSSTSTSPPPETETNASLPTAETVERLLLEVQTDAELPSLPKHLLPELIDLCGRLRQRAEMAAQQAAARVAVQAQLRMTTPSVEAKALSEPATLVQTTNREAEQNDLPEKITASTASGESRTDTAPESAAPEHARPRQQAAGASTSTAATTAATDIPERRAQRGTALAALQAALEEGALLKAMEQDRLLRALDGDGVRIPAAQSAALQAARAELARLQGWARWGGAVSRDEMVASVEALPQQSLSIGELARKVGSMRERWRALDATAGVAPRAAWLRFDAACTAAYAPVAAHLANLDTQRKAHAEQARALLSEIFDFHATLPLAGTDVSARVRTPATAGTAMTDAATDPAIGAASDSPIDLPTGAMPHAFTDAAIPGLTDMSAAVDWRNLSAFCQRQQQAWRRLGPLERREQKRLDAAFAEAMRPLLHLLEQGQAAEMAARQRLIADVAALSPLARETPDRLQALQTRWQQAARAFPLPRQQEQAVWEQFRQACDRLFAARKEAGAAADAQRADNLARKRATCDALDALGALVDGREDVDANFTANSDANFNTGTGADPEPAWRARLRMLRAEWDGAGPVPRAAEDALEKRYSAALAHIEQGLSARRRQAATIRRDAILGRLLLCLDVERNAVQAVADGATPAADERAESASAARAAWRGLPPVGDASAASLQARFDAAITALEQPDPHYRARLQEAQAERDLLLLRLETLLGISSPARLARDRMAFQVAQLQSAFNGPGAGNAQKGGALAPTTAATLQALQALPALADDEARARIVAVLQAA